MWYWPSQAAFIGELERELNVSQIPDEFVEEVHRVIFRFVSGKAKRNRDYKELVSFREDSMIELRFTLTNGHVSVPVRLICSSQSAGLFLLKWHAKDPGTEPSLQRALMNSAVAQAINRLERNRIDRGVKDE
jgi:hypothetical protein